MVVHLPNKHSLTAALSIPFSADPRPGYPHFHVWQHCWMPFPAHQGNTLRAASGVSVDSDVETESEPVSSIGLLSEGLLFFFRIGSAFRIWPWQRGRNWALVKAPSFILESRPKSYCVRGWLFLTCWKISPGASHQAWHQKGDFWTLEICFVGFVLRVTETCYWFISAICTEP